MILSLFFTRGISLKRWIDSGLFEREKQLYECHLKTGYCKKIYWLTYGSNDYALAQSLKEKGELHSGIIICQMPAIFNISKIGSWLYSFVMPLMHYKEICNSDIIKTNQIDGSWGAVIGKLLFRKTLIVRTGYTLSQLENELKRLSLGKRKIIEQIEKIAYYFSDAAIVSSKHNKEYLIDKYNIKADKIHVLYNYIDTSLFSPDDNALKRTNKIVYVGRLSFEKNLESLIAAIADTNSTLDIYGQGDLRDSLELYVDKIQAKVNFMGVVPNSELPKILNQYKYYILPSLYEGMPKTLLEAMACGLICIGTNVSGINEVINDGVNGYLAYTVDSVDLIEKIEVAKSEGNFEMRKQARKFIEKDFSLSSFAEKERCVFDVTIGLRRHE